MPTPRLIHPVNITISRIDRAATDYDPDTREPIQQASRVAAVILQGQPKWKRLDKTSMHGGGDRREAKGYILFRKDDMDAAGFTVAIGDKITKVGHVDCELYVIEREWTAHYQSFSGPSLLKAYFADRHPGKQSGA